MSSGFAPCSRTTLEICAGTTCWAAVGVLSLVKGRPGSHREERREPLILILVVPRRLRRADLLQDGTRQLQEILLRDDAESPSRADVGAIKPGGALFRFPASVKPFNQGQKAAGRILSPCPGLPRSSAARSRRAGQRHDRHVGEKASGGVQGHPARMQLYRGVRSHRSGPARGRGGVRDASSAGMYRITLHIHMSSGLAAKAAAIC